MKTYNAVFNVKKSHGVFGISLVENPAMEGNFIAFSADQGQKIQLKTLNEEKRLLLGLVLEPNKPVYRRQGGEEFNIVFSEDTVSELAHHFFKGGYQSNSTIEHANRIEGVTFVQSWTVEDPKMDKSVNFGLSYPKGSWLAMMKVDSDEVWNNYVKTGKVKGFSIDAMVELEEVKLKSNVNMGQTANQPSWVDAFAARMSEIFNKTEPKKAEIKMGMVKSADGMDFEFEGDTLEVGGMVWVKGEGDMRVPLPVGNYPLEDGNVLIVAEEGVVGEVQTVQAPEQEGEMPADMNSAPAAPSAEPSMSEFEQAIKSILVKYKEDTDNKIQLALTKQSEELKAVKTELAELKKEPAAKPKRSAPAAKIELNKEGRLLQTLRNNR